MKPNKRKDAGLGPAATSPCETETEELGDAEPRESAFVINATPWYEDGLNRIREGFGDDGTDRLADRLEQMISEKNFSQCDADLGVIAEREAQYPADALITILTFSRMARSHLPNRALLLQAVRRRLVALGKSADAILRRL